MKKLMTLILTVALCACLSIPFAGCDSGWVEVQSITYTTRSGETKTITSKCYWEITSEIITKAEYDNAPIEIKGEFFYLVNDGEEIPQDRKAFKTYINSLKGTYFYNCQYIYEYPGFPDGNKVYTYYKQAIKSYELKYVNVKISDNDSIEIKYDNITQTIAPTYVNDASSFYQITYFND